MFHQYVWDLYLNAGGTDVVKIFECNLKQGFSKEYADFVVQLQKVYCPSETVLGYTKNELLELFTDLADGVCFSAKRNTTVAIMRALYREIEWCNEGFPKKVFSHFTNYISYYTTLLFIKHPKLFLPYYFQFNFNVLEKIAQEFEIDLPPIPKKKDYEGRFFYYGKICEGLQAFREEHDLSPYELCAFLYDFAPKYIGGIDSYIIRALPEPKSAYFIGGAKDDAFLKEDPELITPWQCSPDTRAGDMVVMYLRTPISAIDSVWRSVSVGFNDPFFEYYRCTYIAHPTKIKQITQKQLEADQVFSEMPIVRKNMQGVNGVELLPSQYNHLVDLSESKVFRFETLPTGADHTFAREKDVEDLLVKPMIQRLGYGEQEWVSQMYMEIGNHNNALIPDFVLLPKCGNGHYSAFAIIEAKLSIASEKYLKEVKVQARSYAKLLGTEYSVVAAKERVWVFHRQDDYSTEVFSASWEELQKADVFSRIFKILGRKK